MSFEAPKKLHDKMVETAEEIRGLGEVSFTPEQREEAQTVIAQLERTLAAKREMLELMRTALEGFDTLAPMLADDEAFQAQVQAYKEGYAESVAQKEAGEELLATLRDRFGMN